MNPEDEHIDALDLPDEPDGSANKPRDPNKKEDMYAEADGFSLPVDSGGMDFDGGIIRGEDDEEMPDREPTPPFIPLASQAPRAHSTKHQTSSWDS